MLRKLRMSELNRVSLDEFRQLEKFPVVLALDNVRSALNVGAVFRTADAFKVQEVLLLGKTPSPEKNPEMRKTALGGDESVLWKQGHESLARLHALKEKGYSIYGVEQTTQSISLESWTPVKGEKTVLVFGNEVTGISDALLALCTRCIEIPQFGTKHSINVSISVGIVLWHRVIREL